LKLPPLALYDDTYVRYERRKAPAKAVAPLHVLHDHLTPIHLNSQLSIDVPDLPEALRSKALIVRVDQAGTPTAVGGTHGDGKITTQVKAFGRYTVMVDTVPPTISNVDLRADMKGRDSFNIKVQDDLSGIGTYKGYINGEWVLLEYEPKLKLLTHHFDKHTQQPGEKEFKLDLTDDRGNRKSWSMKFTR
jgi:hypothetical protein